MARFTILFGLLVFGLLHGQASLDQWTYIQVDDQRAFQAFGLALGDLTGDGMGDIASGGYFYRNPGGGMAAAWNRTALPGEVDAVLIVDVDGDDRGDIIAQRLPDVLWLEAGDPMGTTWTARVIGSLPATGHGNAQGYALGQIVAGGRPEVLLNSGGGIHYFEIPADPSAGPWPKVRITTGTTEEGIGIGDIDGDGRVDICGGMEGSGTIAWWKNPGNGGADWTRFEIGAATNPDRAAAADLNADGRLDIVVTEEIIVPEKASHLYWFEQPADPESGGWTRRSVAVRYPLFSLDAADMDGDGDIDLVTAENAIGANDNKEQTIVWENNVQALSWTPHVVETGKEGHLGARLADLEGDGDLDIASICWTTYPFLHLWRNDAGPAASSGVALPEGRPPPATAYANPVLQGARIFLSPRSGIGQVRMEIFDARGIPRFRREGRNLNSLCSSSTPIAGGVYSLRVSGATSASRHKLIIAEYPDASMDQKDEF